MPDNNNINNTLQHREDILKAEIGSLLFNLGKTHIGFWNKKNGQEYWKTHFEITDENSHKDSFKEIFGFETVTSYKPYFDEIFKDELEKINQALKKFWIDLELNTFDDNGVITNLQLIDVISKAVSASKKIGSKIFFNGCENINSGIDKGAPKKQLKDKLWYSNSFGSFIDEINSVNFDMRRRLFFFQLYKFLKNRKFIKEDGSPKNLTYFEWKAIRNYILQQVKDWYSNLLSDSRYPINDVTLWEQAYMSATMFKAILAGLYYDNSLYTTFINSPSEIKWSIIGIQYDKLGLAEKGLKIGNIIWYREITNEIDEAVKRFFEIEFPIANEIYRDETGIYFLISHLFLDNNDKLKSDIKEKVQTEIFSIFESKTDYEFYPYIAVTEPSRGLMQLTKQLDEAKDNFLKARQPRVPILDFTDYHSDRVRGVCSICGVRLAEKRIGGQYADLADEEKYICDTCLNRKVNRVERWINNIEGETVWTGDLKDKNGRIALVTMKFELQEWLNGNLLSSILVQDLIFSYLKIIEQLYSDLKQKKLEYYNTILETDFYNFLNFFDEGGIKNPGINVLNDLQKISGNNLNSKILKDNLNNRNERIKKTFLLGIAELLSFLNITLNDVKDFLKTKYSIPENKFNNNLQARFFKSQNIGTTVNINDVVNFFKSLFISGYSIFLIKQTLLDRSLGAKFEEFLKNKFGEFIDYQNSILHWDKLDPNKVEDLKKILYQLLVRKNPSPARLYRIWNNTKEFFIELRNLMPEIISRRIRYVWTLSSEDQPEENANYYYYGPMQFWHQNGRFYQITYDENFENNLPDQFVISSEDRSSSITLQKANAQPYNYVPYFSIIEPTPISWQFIIPADKVPNLIEITKELYNKHFHWVYGKLPLHIGIIFQDYKKPLYVGIKALRQIRRDGFEFDDFSIELEDKDIARLRKNWENSIRMVDKQHLKLEVKNQAYKYYSLYFTDNGEYEFAFPNLFQDNFKKVGNPNKQTQKVIIFPNTFDFEYLETNARRNDIYYIKKENNDNGVSTLKIRRLPKFKRHRPHLLDNWEKFKTFKEAFDKENKSARSTRLQKLISVLISELDKYYTERESNSDLEFSNEFIVSAFINTLGLTGDNDLKQKIFKILDIEEALENNQNISLYNLLKDNLTEDKILLFLDMFDFWHNALKQV